MSARIEHDISEPNVRAIVANAAAILLLIIAAGALVRMLALSRGTPLRAVTRSVSMTPPLARTDARDELHRYQRAQSARLESYGRDELSPGFAHIPIERAMQLLVQQPRLYPAQPPLAAPVAPIAPMTPMTPMAPMAPMAPP